MSQLGVDSASTVDPFIHVVFLVVSTWPPTSICEDIAFIAILERQDVLWGDDTARPADLIQQSLSASGRVALALIQTIDKLDSWELVEPLIEARTNCTGIQNGMSRVVVAYDGF